MRTWSTFWNVKHAPLHAFLSLGLSQVGGANRVIFQLTDTCFKADAGGFCHSCPLGTWRSIVISSWSAGGWCIWDGKAAEQMRRTDRGELRVSWRSESYHNPSSPCPVFVLAERSAWPNLHNWNVLDTFCAERERCSDTESTKGIPSDQNWSLDDKNRWFPSDFGTDRSFKLSC